MDFGPVLLCVYLNGLRHTTPEELQSLIERLDSS